MPTKIEWAEESWNPITGCTPISEGCANCYAKRMARRLAGRYGYPPDAWHCERCDAYFRDNPNLERCMYCKGPLVWSSSFDVTYHHDRMMQPARWKAPRRIFVCSMSDLFHESLDFRVIELVMGQMTICSRHTFMVLTKRPKRVLQYIEWYETEVGFQNYSLPPQIWLGVTAENQKRADERIPILLQIPAAVRFVSVEPMLGPVDMWGGNNEAWPLAESGIRWVIVGGETGPRARPMHPDWMRGVRDQCRAAGVPFFFKQWGAWEAGETREESFGPVEVGERCVEHNGKWTRMYRVGKKAAGRLLDGREWNEYPEQEA